MKKVFLCVGALALATTLSACGRSDEAANEVAANDMNAMKADPNNPFTESEMKMDQAMAAAVGTSAADSWVRKMIEHHRGAVEMSRIVLTQKPPAEAATMARQTVAKQTAEIAELEKLVASGTPDPASAVPYRTASMQMHEAMMAAKGVDLSETYLRKMIAHHEGAVALSDVALAQGATGALRARVEKVKADQEKEIGMVEAMLRGEAMPAATPAVPAAKAKPAASPTAKAAPRPAASPRPSPIPDKPASATPSPDPHAGHDMSKM